MGLSNFTGHSDDDASSSNGSGGGPAFLPASRSPACPWAAASLTTQPQPKRCS
ncbi:hypothetical protein AHiyo8_01790 [Arthrobacter sp. Hiyo8]|nr:hypothetical protein AHiyo8_01790 [Arthrobacter sp. Hiyo8]